VICAVLELRLYCPYSEFETSQLYQLSWTTAQLCVWTDKYVSGGAHYGRLLFVCDDELRNSHLDNRSTQRREQNYWQRRHRRCGKYRVFQKKVAALKLFGIFPLRLSLFAWNFANLLAIHIHIISTIFCRFILIFHPMALIFPRLPIVFTLSSFE